jgi:hypothetical protein
MHNEQDALAKVSTEVPYFVSSEDDLSSRRFSSLDFDEKALAAFVTEEVIRSGPVRVVDSVVVFLEESLCQAHCVVFNKCANMHIRLKSGAPQFANHPWLFPTV